MTNWAIGFDEILKLCQKVEMEGMSNFRANLEADNYQQAAMWAAQAIAAERIRKKVEAVMQGKFESSYKAPERTPHA